MKIPFLKRKKVTPVRPLEIKDIKASTFFSSASIEDKNIVFSKAMKEANKEQKEVVRKFGKK